jgi:PAS domain S-box-containing protein
MSLYVLALYLVAVSLLVHKFFRSHGFSRAQTGTVIAGTLIPVLGALLTLFDFAPTFHRDMTPFTFALGNLIITWGLFNYRLFDLVPIARDTVLDTMADPVVVLDVRNRVLDLNPAALNAIGTNSGKVIGRPAKQAFETWSHLVDQLWDTEDGSLEIELGSEAGPLFYELQVSPLRNLRGQVAGRLIVAHDVTGRKGAERRLQQAHDDLESRVLARTAELQATNERLQAETAERRQAEGAVQEGEARYRSLVENLPIGVYQSTPGPEGKFLMVNSAFRTIFGFDQTRIFAVCLLLSVMSIHPIDRVSRSSSWPRGVLQGSSCT